MHAVGIDDRLMRALHEQFRAAADAGHDAEDMATVVHALRS
jgi:3-hydroxyisobutyrate dehydrogenase